MSDSTPAKPLTGKTALVTGASQGIGRSVALYLAAGGARVILAARSADKLAGVADEIKAAGGEAHPFALDISQETSVKETAKAILAAHGTVEILVNNAGITRDGLIMRMKRHDWDDVLTTNVSGAFLLTQALLPAMVKARWGRIVNISSIVGQTGQAGQVNYASAKAGITGMTRTLAKEWGRYKVNVNCVAFGFIRTRLTNVAAGGDGAISIEGRSIKVGVSQELLEMSERMIPLGRAGTPGEAAGAVFLFCLPESDYVSGQTLVCGGGLEL